MPPPRRAELASPSTRPDPPRASSKAADARQRILAAALNEFAEKGLSGARVESIARAADVNIRMLYYYYGSKERLFEEVLRTHLEAHARQIAAEDQDVAAFLRRYLEMLGDDKAWVRLLQWEALEAPSREPTPERKAQYEHVITELAPNLQNGPAARCNPNLTIMALVGLSVFPFAFPQIAKLMTGSDNWSAPERRREWDDCVLHLAQLITGLNTSVGD
ncbi:TetR/AcrR family transcriptional regulator [Streptomyces mirabilis]|uniref:TetR/AcrR family transcriptional regulator n=1 Tax=Streptomyces mirabilis TaxID=68239 RepID=UPI003689BBBC